MWLWGCNALQTSGFVGLVATPMWLPVLWAALCGAGLAGRFARCLIVALDHLPDPARAGPLAARMLGGGFTLAAAPPLIPARIGAAR